MQLCVLNQVSYVYCISMPIEKLYRLAVLTYNSKNYFKYIVINFEERLDGFDLWL